MRRKDREITDIGEIKSILNECHACHLGLRNEDEVYVVPVNFGWTLDEENRLTLYFHGAKEGRKLTLLRRNGEAGFEMDCRHQLTGSGDNACVYSYCYGSVIGIGTVTILESAEEKEAALKHIMMHETGRDNFTFGQGMVEQTAVYTLTAKWYTCKEKRMPSPRQS